MCSPVIASSVVEVFPSVFEWSAFSPHHKVELSSHAVLHRGVMYVFDPISLTASAMGTIWKPGDEWKILLTNGNHERAAVDWKKNTGTLIYGHRSLMRELPLDDFIYNEQCAGLGVHCIDLKGGGEGETGFFFDDCRTLVLGDALVHLEGRGLEVLPGKYCRNQGELLSNLKKLTSLPVEKMVCAHGGPIQKDFIERLTSILA